MEGTREKLIAIIEEARREAVGTVGSMNNGFAAWYADKLLAAGVAPAQGWIPVTERVPDVPGHVLVWDNTAKLRKILWYHDCKGWGVEDKHPKRYFGNASDQRRYTHWMPLPEPPKEEHNGTAQT